MTEVVEVGRSVGSERIAFVFMRNYTSKGVAYRFETSEEGGLERGILDAAQSRLLRLRMSKASTVLRLLTQDSVEHKSFRLVEVDYASLATAQIRFEDPIVPSALPRDWMRYAGLAYVLFLAALLLFILFVKCTKCNQQ